MTSESSQTRGRLLRVYGGALPIPAPEPPVRERAALATESKERVARAAVATVHPGSTIVLDAGTTTLAMARLLPSGTGITVITPSLRHRPRRRRALGTRG